MNEAKPGTLASKPETLEILARFSNTTISSSQAAELLGVGTISEVLDLLGMTSLPFPSLPDEQIDAMARS